MRDRLPDIGQPLDELSWGDDRHPDAVELEQIAVAGHERIDARPRASATRQSSPVSRQTAGTTAQSAAGVMTPARSATNQMSLCDREREREREREPQPLAPEHGDDLAEQRGCTHHFDPLVQQRIQRAHGGGGGVACERGGTKLLVECAARHHDHEPRTRPGLRQLHRGLADRRPQHDHGAGQQLGASAGAAAFLLAAAGASPIWCYRSSIRV
jgi:hypothetical protein